MQFAGLRPLCHSRRVLQICAGGLRATETSQFCSASMTSVLRLTPVGEHGLKYRLEIPCPHLESRSKSWQSRGFMKPRRKCKTLCLSRCYSAAGQRGLGLGGDICGQEFERCEVGRAHVLPRQSVETVQMACASFNLTFLTQIIILSCLSRSCDQSPLLLSRLQCARKGRSPLDRYMIRPKEAASPSA